MNPQVPTPGPRILDRPERAVPAFQDNAETGVDAAVEALAHARREAREEGYRQAVEEFAADRRAFAVQTAQTLTRLAEFEEATARRHNAEVAEIVIEAVSRIVRLRVDAGDPVALRALREAQDALPSTTGLRARLHPADLEVATRELQSDVERGRIQLVSDDTLTLGGCVLESAVGTVDATIETAHEAIRDALLGKSA